MLTKVDDEHLFFGIGFPGWMDAPLMGDREDWLTEHDDAILPLFSCFPVSCFPVSDSSAVATGLLFSRHSSPELLPPPPKRETLGARVNSGAHGNGAGDGYPH